MCKAWFWNALAGWGLLPGERKTGHAVLTGAAIRRRLRVLLAHTRHVGESSQRALQHARLYCQHLFVEVLCNNLCVVAFFCMTVIVFFLNCKNNCQTNIKTSPAGCQQLLQKEEKCSSSSKIHFCTSPSLRWAYKFNIKYTCRLSRDVCFLGCRATLLHPEM